MRQYRYSKQRLSGLILNLKHIHVFKICSLSDDVSVISKLSGERYRSITSFGSNLLCCYHILRIWNQIHQPQWKRQQKKCALFRPAIIPSSRVEPKQAISDSILVILIREPQNGKANKMICAPSEDSDQPGHLANLIRVFAMRSMVSHGLHASSCGQRRLSEDWADSQAGLSLRWAHKSFGWFCRAAAQIIKLNHNRSVLR